MRVTGYQLIARENASEIVRAVRDGLALGWQPYGYPSVWAEGDRGGLVQAMVRAEEHHEELERLRSMEAQVKMLPGELESQRGVIGDEDMVDYAVAALRAMVGSGE